MCENTKHPCFDCIHNKCRDLSQDGTLYRDCGEMDAWCNDLRAYEAYYYDWVWTTVREDSEIPF